MSDGHDFTAFSIEDQPPVPGGTTAIRNGQYVREERAPGPPSPTDDFLDEIIAERSAANPDFPRLVADALTTDDTRPHTATGKLVADEFFSLLVDNFAGTKRWNEQEQLRRVDALVAGVEAEALDAERSHHAALDVERLANALVFVIRDRGYIDLGVMDITFAPENVMDVAEAIAAALDGAPR